MGAEMHTKKYELQSEIAACDMCGKRGYVFELTGDQVCTECLHEAAGIGAVTYQLLSLEDAYDTP